MENNKPYIIYFAKLLPIFFFVYWVVMPLLDGMMFGFTGDIATVIQQQFTGTPVGILAVFIIVAVVLTRIHVGKRHDEK
ncbi:MAG: hypothetical protein HRU29_03975 [Rhizobiales bacterium]|nr:hypothetical protein [Hyphomicrobiales bacterium]NRB13539.1 hypothetical protein [Hyphomicrobiales bacterium]